MPPERVVPTVHIGLVRCGLAIVVLAPVLPVAMRHLIFWLNSVWMLRVGPPGQAGYFSAFTQAYSDQLGFGSLLFGMLVHGVEIIAIVFSVMLLCGFSPRWFRRLLGGLP